jgi:hypothetical protein
MSAFITFLNHWWNLPYLVMLALVAIFFIMQLVGLAGDHGHGHGGDHDGAIQHDAAHATLAWFGVGKVPLFVVWVTLFVFAGFTGLIMNRIMYLEAGAVPAWYFAVTVVVALVVGLGGVRLFAGAAAKFLRLDGPGSTSKHTLAGRAGVVASPVLDGRHGEVRVHDGASEILVHGKLHDGEPALKMGARVVLVDYDPKSELFWVTAAPDSDVA